MKRLKPEAKEWLYACLAVIVFFALVFAFSDEPNWWMKWSPALGLFVAMPAYPVLGLAWDELKYFRRGMVSRWRESADFAFGEDGTIRFVFKERVESIHITEIASLRWMMCPAGFDFEFASHLARTQDLP